MPVKKQPAYAKELLERYPDLKDRGDPDSDVLHHTDCCGVAVARGVNSLHLGRVDIMFSIAKALFVHREWVGAILFESVHRRDGTEPPSMKGIEELICEEELGVLEQNTPFVNPNSGCTITQYTWVINFPKLQKFAAALWHEQFHARLSWGARTCMHSVPKRKPDYSEAPL